MTGGYTISAIEDVRGIAKLVRDSRSSGGVETIPPMVQSSPGGGSSVYVATIVPGVDGIAYIFAPTTPSGVTMVGSLSQIELTNGKTMTGIATCDMAMEIMPGRAFDPLFTRAFVAWTDAVPRVPIVSSNVLQEGFAAFGSQLGLGNSWFGAGVSFTGAYPSWIPFTITFPFTVTNSSGGNRKFAFYHSAGDSSYDWDWSGISRTRMGRVSLMYTAS